MSEIRQVKEKIKPYIPLFAGNLIFSIVLYYLLISHQLVNSNDGLWEYNYYKAGKWSLSLGRWFWLYLDRLRFGISTEPLTSLITLTCFSMGIILILDLFDMKSKTGYLAGMLFLSSTSICISLSYRYMSPTFGVAFLFSVLAAWIVIRLKNSFLSVALAGVLIALSMGLYQAYLGCTCIVLLGYFIYSLYKEDTALRDVLIQVVKAVIAGIIGGILYVAILNIHLNFFHMYLSDYNGANTYSLINTIRKLPDSIVNSYKVFFRFFNGELYRLNVLQGAKLNWFAFLIAVIFFVKGFFQIWPRGKFRALLYVVFILAIPAACNVVLLIATAVSMELQMTAPLSLFISILLCIESKIVSAEKLFLWVRRLNLLLLAVILYGNIYQVQIDQTAMQEGQTATVTMAEEITHRLDEEGYLASDLNYCLIGPPAYSDLFPRSRIYQSANAYARFGDWYLDPACARRSWQSVFSNLCGVNLTMCSSGEYSDLGSREEVQNLPVYPQEGFITVINDIVVIKVSE